MILYFEKAMKYRRPYRKLLRPLKKRKAGGFIVILDTDHMSLSGWSCSLLARNLETRLQPLPATDVSTTIINYEEHIRGRASYYRIYSVEQRKPTVRHNGPENRYNRPRPKGNITIAQPQRFGQIAGLELGDWTA